MPLPAPSLRRRMAAFLYEGVLLFGVTFFAGFLYATLTQQRHALQGHAGLQAMVFVVVGLYFGWFWSHGGQTLAMKTWRIRLVAQDGGRVAPLRAACRYLLSWVWLLPPLALAFALHGGGSGGLVTLLTLVWIGAYALSSFLQPQRQFWHDVLCGTRLVPSENPR